QLFAVGGTRAMPDGELSFNAKFNKETGTYEPINDSFNQVVVNSKTPYKVSGLLDLSEGNTTRYALKLYNETGDHFTFIIREGEDALDQIGGFVQNRFYNYDGMTKQQKREVSEAALRDASRRKYDRLFSLEKAGTGQTAGYNAAERLFRNADDLEKRLRGKDKSIRGEQYSDLVQDRITHEELQEQLKDQFNSLWDPNSK